MYAAYQRDQRALWLRETELFLKLLDEWFSGRELSNRVDFSRGY